jgi:hypothetical protein
MLAVHPRFAAIMLHPIYALGLFGFFAAIFPLSLGRILTLMIGELFLLPWTGGFLALWWSLLKRSGISARILSPRRKLAQGAALGIIIFVVTGSFFYLGLLVGLLVMVLTAVAGAIVIRRRWMLLQKVGLWWPTTSTGAWVGIVAGLYVTAVLIASASPNLG